MATRTAGTSFWGLVLLGALVVSAAAVALVVGLAGLVLWLVVRHPFCVVAAAATVGAHLLDGPMAAVLLWSAVAGGALVWRAGWRASYDRRVVRRWRRTFVYGWRWRRALAACDLDGRVRSATGRRIVPRLGNVRSSGLTDTISVRPLDDQDARCFAARADDLARELGALTCSVRADVTGAVHLELRRRGLVERVRPGDEPIDIRRVLPGPPGRPVRCPHGTHRRARVAA